MRSLAGLLVAAAVTLAACGSSTGDTTTVDPPPSSAPPSTAAPQTTLGPGSAAVFDDLGLSTIVPDGWFLQLRDGGGAWTLATGSAAMLYDAGDTGALVILGKTAELDEPVDGATPAEVAAGTARVLSAFFFPEPGTATESAEAAVVSGEDAAVAEIRIDHTDGTSTVTRVLALDHDGEWVYAALLYQGGFPPERIAQGLAVLEQLALLP